MTTLVFGHKSPDTDASASAIIWAWYLSDQKGESAKAVVLGQPNQEALFVLERWGFAVPEIVDQLPPDSTVVIVDTNNIAELPGNILEAKIASVIDHHKLTPGLETDYPIDVTIRPYACTATVMCELMGDASTANMPDPVKGLCLSCILSDTLGFRSPTTTPLDESLATRLADELGVEVHAYAEEMFAAKSNVSHIPADELVCLDAKQYPLAGESCLVSVIETTTPEGVLSRRDELISSFPAVRQAKGVDRILLFIVDIFRQEATLLVPDEQTRQIAQSRFGVSTSNDMAVLPGIVSRKKQIVPALSQA